MDIFSVVYLCRGTMSDGWGVRHNDVVLDLVFRDEAEAVAFVAAYEAADHRGSCLECNKPTEQYAPFCDRCSKKLARLECVKDRTSRDGRAGSSPASAAMTSGFTKEQMNEVAAIAYGPPHRRGAGLGGSIRSRT